jgi:hypothetical protein
MGLYLFECHGQFMITGISTVGVYRWLTMK